MALVQYLKEGGPERVHNIDNLLLRESMDVIGQLPSPYRDAQKPEQILLIQTRRSCH